MFSFEIIHCKGVDNVAADYLSRIVTGKNDETDEKMFAIAGLDNKVEAEKKVVYKINRNSNPLFRLIKKIAKHPKI